MKKPKVNSSIDVNLIDSLIKQYDDPADIFRENGLMMQLKKAIVERVMEGELTTELGYEKHDAAGNHSGNSRNGNSEKTLKCNDGHLPIKVPRDRNGNYEPKIIPKNQTRFDDMDDKIISLYARGMTTRDIQDQLKDLYHVDVSATLISNVTDEVIDVVKAWQSRPLDKVYPIVYMDALVIKIQQDKRVINKSFYLALGVNTEGKKELLGIWISENEGAKFWLNVLTEIKNRGVSDIFISCVDGLTGLLNKLSKKILSLFPSSSSLVTFFCIYHSP